MSIFRSCLRKISNFKKENLRIRIFLSLSIFKLSCRTGGNCGWTMRSGTFCSLWYCVSSWFCGGPPLTTRGNSLNFSLHHLRKKIQVYDLVFRFLANNFFFYWVIPLYQNINKSFIAEASDLMQLCLWKINL